MARGVSLQGGDRLDLTFRSLARSVARDALAEGVKEGAEIVREDAARRAPRRTGNLASNIDVQVTKSGSTTARAVVATTDDGFYGAFVEYGHDIVVDGKVVGHVPAQPFLRPAFDENQDKVEAAIGSAIQRAIEGAIKL